MAAPPVPFKRLVQSTDRQVRRGSSTSKLSIAELAASIEAGDVMQDLRSAYRSGKLMSSPAKRLRR